MESTASTVTSAMGLDLPYPPSPALALAAVSEAATRRDDLDGDDWPITWADDDDLYAAYGDGWGCRPIEKDTKHNTGLVRLLGTAEDFRGEEVPVPWFGRGAENPNFKGCGLLSAGGVLYHFVRYQSSVDPATGKRQQIASKLIWSTDHGHTWENADAYAPDARAMCLFFDEPDHAFHSPAFLQAGRDYVLAQDEYVYVYSPREDRRRANDRLDLARVAREHVADRAAYEFFAGLDGGDGGHRPRWTRDVAARHPVFAFDGHVNSGDVVYNAPLGRYLLATCTGDFAPGEKDGTPSSLAFFDAPHPWGPWTAVGYVPQWGTGRGGDLRYDPRLPVKWLSDDGLAATLIYSDRILSDKLNLQQVQFARRGRNETADECR
ncbi:MAG: DUF4185 domain-containing protein [Chloroflexi bacterium]|nr:DUF4185 domain-containing protein [Chloroflexota bacterium]